MSVEEFRKLKKALLQSGVTGGDTALFRSFFFGPKLKKMNSLTTDRIDNADGYRLPNICKACWFCNKVKGHVLTGEDMDYLGPRLLKRVRKAAENGMRRR